MPPLAIQRKISAVLSAYDDLIENNDRRINILEEMAQRIYREWFVDFRFPGHEDVPLVDSELGRMPAGWEVRPLSELATIVMGQSPPSEFYNRGGEGLPFHQGVGTYGSFFPRHEVFSTAGVRLADDGDILVSVRAPVGRMNIADRQMILGRGLAGIRAVDNAQSFLFFLLRSVFAIEDSMGSGSIFQAVTKSDMERIPVVAPPGPARTWFEGVAAPTLSLIRTLTQASERLRATRDLLLPRLISGELDVEHLNISVDEAAA